MGTNLALLPASSSGRGRVRPSRCDEDEDDDDNLEVVFAAGRPRRPGMYVCCLHFSSQNGIILSHLVLKMLHSYLVPLTYWDPNLGYIGDIFPWMVFF